jgi:hypothetical protein
VEFGNPSILGVLDVEKILYHPPKGGRWRDSGREGERIQREVGREIERGRERGGGREIWREVESERERVRGVERERDMDM